MNINSNTGTHLGIDVGNVGIDVGNVGIDVSVGTSNNEGHGDIAEDYTGHGNDAHVHISPAVWPQGIEVTQKNKE